MSSVFTTSSSTAEFVPLRAVEDESVSRIPIVPGVVNQIESLNYSYPSSLLEILNE